MDRRVRLAAAPGDRGLLELPGQRTLILGFALGLALVAGGWWYLRIRPAGGGAPLIPGDAGPRVSVEVLNATEVDGLAREIARRLRREGIDVVDFGSATQRGLDSTRILVRRGDSAAAAAVRRVLGAGRISTELDARRLLDATVLVGRDLAPKGNGNP